MSLYCHHLAICCLECSQEQNTHTSSQDPRPFGPSHARTQSSEDASSSLCVVIKWNDFRMGNRCVNIIIKITGVMKWGEHGIKKDCEWCLKWEFTIPGGTLGTSSGIRLIERYLCAVCGAYVLSSTLYGHSGCSEALPRAARWALYSVIWYGMGQ
jgi:hypothetical protein